MSGDPPRSGPLLVAPSRTDALLLAVAVCGVSLSGPLIAATAVPALAIAFWRNAMGGAVVAGWAVLRRRGELAAMTRRDWLLAALAGLFLAGHFGSWVPSLTFTSVASSAALVTTTPVWVAAYGRLAGQTVAPVVWLGTGVAVIGAAVVAGVDFDSSARALGGDLLAIAGAAFAGAYATTGASVRRRVSTVSYTTICYGVCAIALLVVCLGSHSSLAGYRPSSWGKLLVLTATAQLLGHSLVNVSLRSASPTVVSLVLLLEVPGAALIAAFWLHQVPGPSLGVGLALLVLGAGLVASAVKAPT